MTHTGTCILLPYPIVYSETFLKVHVEHLSSTVRYLEHFPVDVDDTYLKRLSSDSREALKQRIKARVHGYVLNPVKSIFLKKFFRKHRVGVVLAEYGSTGAEAVGMCEELRIPLVVHFHGSDAYSRHNLERYEENYKKMFAYSKAIIAVSRDMIQQLVRLGAPPQKIFYNPYGVEISKFKPATASDSTQVIAVGRFIEKKAPYLTILAFKEVLEKLPQAKLVMVGGGPLRNVCSQLIRSLHIGHAVELKGVLNSDEIASLMRGSRLFVQHSLVPESGDSEGTPLAILEAGASGLPVVSTRHAGILDAVLEGETGLLVDEGDVDGMAGHMYRLLCDHELAARMGARARDHIAANFDLKNSIEKLRGILEEHSLHAR